MPEEASAVRSVQPAASAGSVEAAEAAEVAEVAVEEPAVVELRVVGLPAEEAVAELED